jgi:hypothetical protein
MVNVTVTGRKTLDKTDIVKEGAIELVNFFLYFSEVINYCHKDRCVVLYIPTCLSLD